MAIRFLILASLAVLASRAQGSGYSTFASTYNAHTINHAVAYPAGSKVPLSAVAFAPPAVIPASVQAVAAAPIPATAAVPASVPTIGSAAAAKPVIFETPTPGNKPDSASAAGGVQVLLSAPGQISFAASPFGSIPPSKVGFPSASVAFSAGTSYPSSPIYAAGPDYTASYGGVPAYSAAPSFTAASPFFATAPAAYPAAAGSAYATPANYAPGSIAFASGTPVTFVSTPAAAASNGAINAKNPFSAPAYVPSW